MRRHNTKRARVAASLAVPMALAPLTAALAAANVTQLHVSGGQFQMGVFTPSPNPLSFTNSGFNLVGGYSSPSWDQTVGQSTSFPSSIVSFNFNGGGTWVNTFTAASASGAAGGGPVPSGVIGGGPGVANGDPLTVDLSSLFANWNGTNFNQGNSSAAGTVSRVSCAGSTNGSTCTFNYTLDWTSLIVGGPFNLQVGTWQFTGTGVAVINDPVAGTGTIAPNQFSTIAIAKSDLTAKGIPADSGFIECADGCFDFKVTGLTVGGSTTVVLPLPKPIPANAVYRKFVAGNWVSFSTQIPNQIASAPLNSSGFCPAPGDVAYRSGLNTGDRCLELRMNDGGPNDTDLHANGVVTDPGSVSVSGTATPPPSSGGITPLPNNSGCSISPTPVSAWRGGAWWLIGTVVGWLGFSRRRRASRRS